MMIERCITAGFAFGLALSLTSCGGGASESGFSAYVADHWPHWAGGMPDDVPPRPGAPGYDEFVAHGQANQDVMKPPAVGANTAGVSAPPVFRATPSTPAATAAAQAAPAAPATPDVQTEPAPDTEAAPQPSSGDSSEVKGGLY
jgi:hypothetical protein